MNATTIILLFSSVIAGAFIVEIFNIKKSKNIQLLLTFSGAYLLAVSVLHLIPEIFSNQIDGKIGIFILVGFLTQILIEYFSQGIEHGHFHKNNMIPFSVLIGLCLHALLEGLPLGSNLHHHTHDTLLYAIVLHKVPVTIVLTTFFLQSNIKKKRVYFLLLLFAVMSPLGAFAGNLFISVTGYHNEIMAIVIGVFLHISTTILFESTAEHKYSLKKIITIIVSSLLAFISL